MPRGKVSISFIQNDAKRRITYNRRKNGLLKKVSELSTLCGIDACAIIYSPFDVEPVVWPNTMGVQRVISFFNNMPEMERTMRMLDQETMLRQKIGKVNQRLKEQLFKNHEKEISGLLLGCLSSGGKGTQNLMPQDQIDLRFKIEQKVDEVNKRIDDLTNIAALEEVAPPLMIINQPLGDMGFGQAEANEIIIPSFNHTTCGHGYANHANPWNVL